MNKQPEATPLDSKLDQNTSTVVSVSERKKSEHRADYAKVTIKDSTSGKVVSTKRVFLLAE